MPQVILVVDIKRDCGWKQETPCCFYLDTTDVMEPEVNYKSSLGGLQLISKHKCRKTFSISFYLLSAANRNTYLQLDAWIKGINCLKILKLPSIVTSEWQHEALAAKQ